MTALDQASVLRRKTRAARGDQDPHETASVRALRLALARAADTLFGLALTVATVEQRRIEAEEIETALGTEGLFMLLDGPGGARGALRFDPAFMSAVIEVQTIGQVLPGQVRARPATRTDAAMLAPLVDAVLSDHDAELARGESGRRPCGLRFADRAENARALALLLPRAQFDFFRVTGDLDHGARTGCLDLLLPREQEAAALHGGRADRARAAAATGPDLAAVALNAPVALDVVLARLRLPLHAVMAFASDTCLELPQEGLGQAQLVGAGGQVIAKGRLGQREGLRAFRLSGPVLEPSPTQPGKGPPPQDGTARTAD